MKKKTLEQVAEEYSKRSTAPVFQEAHKQDFIAGAEWQSKKMYSEEEVLVLLHKRDNHNIDNPNTFNGWLTPKEWFEQFKQQDER